MKENFRYLVFYTYTKKTYNIFTRSKVYNGKKEICLQTKISNITDLINLENTIKEFDLIKDINIINFVEISLDK